jgi:hypothetical protein
MVSFYRTFHHCQALQVYFFNKQKSPVSTSGEMNCASDEGGAFFVPLASLTIFRIIALSFTLIYNHYI